LANEDLERVILYFYKTPPVPDRAGEIYPVFRKIVLIIVLIIPIIAFAQQLTNYGCDNAVPIPSGKEVCLTNVVTSTDISNNVDGKAIWFKYTPLDGYDIFITISDVRNGDSFLPPRINVSANCPAPGGNFSLNDGDTDYSNDITTCYVRRLKIGQPYYILVDFNFETTFNICIQNINAPVLVKPGQDCNTAQYLCSTESVRALNITGGGNDVNEVAGTCLERYPETNSAWFKWTAATTGTLVFTITPLVRTDDLDWVLFDLGTADNCNGKTVIACANGSGIDCGLPGSPGYYYITGLDFNSTDTGELAGCVPGQDGKVRYVIMQEGHIYALMVNNSTSKGNGFILDFTDQNGKAGTGTVSEPQAVIDFKQNNPCTVDQSYTFKSLSINAGSLKWNFGEGASISSATTEGPFTITYSTPGTKTVVLETEGTSGCHAVDAKTFPVYFKAPTPVIKSNKPRFCLGDTIILSTPPLPDAKYYWTGPNGLTSLGASISIPVTSTKLSGTYTVIAILSSCNSDPATITIPAIFEYPAASFSTLPTLPAKLSAPVTVKFFNQSINADTYSWNFGDHSTSAEANPEHTYTLPGAYSVTLTASQSNACNTSVKKGIFYINASNALFIPNTFTPNGDNINDEFVVNISNLQNYRIRIVNRLGQLLFVGTDIFDNWKGLYHGTPLPSGPYYYVIDAVAINGTAVQKKGSITIIK